MSLLNRLRENDKKGLFASTQTSVTYQTGFLPFDYANGYKVTVRDMDENPIEDYFNTGLVGGTFVTVVGKSGTAKTTFVVQATANIVRKFDNAFVMHYDLEQALTYTRIKDVTGLSQVDLKEKYILKQEKNYIEDIADAIVSITKAKEAGGDEFKYDTGLKDEFNNPIKAYVPTFVILDSIPTVTSKDAQETMEGQTYANRAAKALAQFYKKLMPVIKTYNITVIAINHINTKIEINPMMKTQPQLMYLKMDESVPGGNAPIYYSHNFLKFVSNGKYVKEDDGFDGFKIRCEFLKSRTNKAGKCCYLSYNQKTGFDPMYTLVEYANDNGLITGRNPKKAFIKNPDVKFDSRKFAQELADQPLLKVAAVDTCVDHLEQTILEDSGENKMTMGEYLGILENIGNVE